MEYTAVIIKEEEWWIGWIKEVPGVNCQERTRRELLKTLATTLKEILEINAENAMSSISGNYSEEKILV